MSIFKLRDTGEEEATRNENLQNTVDNLRTVGMQRDMRAPLRNALARRNEAERRAEQAFREEQEALLEEIQLQRRREEEDRSAWDSVANFGRNVQESIAEEFENAYTTFGKLQLGVEDMWRTIGLEPDMEARGEQFIQKFGEAGSAVTERLGLEEKSEELEEFAEESEERREERMEEFKQERTLFGVGRRRDWLREDLSKQNYRQLSGDILRTGLLVTSVASAGAGVAGAAGLKVAPGLSKALFGTQAAKTAGSLTFKQRASNWAGRAIGLGPADDIPRIVGSKSALKAGKELVKSSVASGIAEAPLESVGFALSEDEPERIPRYMAENAVFNSVFYGALNTAGLGVNYSASKILEGQKKGGNQSRPQDFEDIMNDTNAGRGPSDLDREVAKNRAENRDLTDEELDIQVRDKVNQEEENISQNVYQGEDYVVLPYLPNLGRAPRENPAPGANGLYVNTRGRSEADVGEDMIRGTFASQELRMLRDREDLVGGRTYDIDPQSTAYQSVKPRIEELNRRLEQDQVDVQEVIDGVEDIKKDLPPEQLRMRQEFETPALDELEQRLTSDDPQVKANIPADLRIRAQRELLRTTGDRDVVNLRLMKERQAGEFTPRYASPMRRAGQREANRRMRAWLTDENASVDLDQIIRDGKDMPENTIAQRMEQSRNLPSTYGQALMMDASNIEQRLLNRNLEDAPNQLKRFQKAKKRFREGKTEATRQKGIDDIVNLQRELGYDDNTIETGNNISQERLDNMSTRLTRSKRFMTAVENLRSGDSKKRARGVKQIDKLREELNAPQAQIKADVQRETFRRQAENPDQELPFRYKEEQRRSRGRTAKETGADAYYQAVDSDLTKQRAYDFFNRNKDNPEALEEFVSNQSETSFARQIVNNLYAKQLIEEYNNVDYGMFRFRQTAEIIRETATDLAMQKTVLDDMPEGMKKVAEFQKRYYDKNRHDFKNQSNKLLKDIYNDKVDSNKLMKILENIICPT